jgi:hypothetical protein
LSSDASILIGNTNGTRDVTHEENMGALLTKVTQTIGDPKKLGTTTSNSYIFGLRGRLSYT